MRKHWASGTVFLKLHFELFYNPSDRTIMRIAWSFFSLNWPVQIPILPILLSGRFELWTISTNSSSHRISTCLVKCETVTILSYENANDVKILVWLKCEPVQPSSRSPIHAKIVNYDKWFLKSGNWCCPLRCYVVPERRFEVRFMRQIIHLFYGIWICVLVIHVICFHF